LFLGDHPRPGLWTIVIAGFIFVSIGTISITRYTSTLSSNRKFTTPD
jgi:hypothetical protein